MLRLGLCYRKSVCRLSSVCLSSVCNVGAPYSRGSTFRQYFFTTVYIGRAKFYGDRPKGTPSPEALNARRVGKYNDFGPVDGYISQELIRRWDTRTWLDVYLIWLLIYHCPLNYDTPVLRNIFEVTRRPTYLMDVGLRKAPCVSCYYPLFVFLA